MTKTDITPKQTLAMLADYLEKNEIPTFSKFDSERQYLQGRKDEVERIIDIIHKMEKGLA